MPIDDFSVDKPDAAPNALTSPGKYIKIAVPDFSDTVTNTNPATMAPAPLTSYLRLGAVEDVTKAGKTTGSVGLVTDLAGNPLTVDANAPFNPSYDPYAPFGPHNLPQNGVTPIPPATTPLNGPNAPPPPLPGGPAYPAAVGPDPTGEDLASLVQGFADDTRNRGKPRTRLKTPGAKPKKNEPPLTPGGNPKDPGTTAQGPLFGYPWVTPITGGKAPGLLDASDASTTEDAKYTESSKPLFFPDDYRTLESSQLHTKGGWRDHTDGNRITTTRGDKVEVIRGNYKLLVLGRQDQTKPKYAGMDLSGGQSDTGGGDLSADASADFNQGSTAFSSLFEWRQCTTKDAYKAALDEVDPKLAAQAAKDQTAADNAVKLLNDWTLKAQAMADPMGYLDATINAAQQMVLTATSSVQEAYASSALGAAKKALLTAEQAVEPNLLQGFALDATAASAPAGTTAATAAAATATAQAAATAAWTAATVPPATLGVADSAAAARKLDAANAASPSWANAFAAWAAWTGTSTSLSTYDQDTSDTTTSTNAATTAAAAEAAATQATAALAAATAALAAAAAADPTFAAVATNAANAANAAKAAKTAAAAAAAAAAADPTNATLAAASTAAATASAQAATASTAAANAQTAAAVGDPLAAAYVNASKAVTAATTASAAATAAAQQAAQTAANTSATAKSDASAVLTGAIAAAEKAALAAWTAAIPLNAAVLVATLAAQAPPPAAPLAGVFPTAPAPISANPGALGVAPTGPSPVGVNPGSLSVAPDTCPGVTVTSPDWPGLDLTDAAAQALAVAAYSTGLMKAAKMEAGFIQSPLETLELWEDEPGSPSDYRSFSTTKKGSGPKVQVKYQAGGPNNMYAQKPGDGVTYATPISMGVSINETWSYQIYNYSGIGYYPATEPQPWPPAPPKTQSQPLSVPSSKPGHREYRRLTATMGGVAPPSEAPDRLEADTADWPVPPQWVIYPVAKIVNKSYVVDQSTEVYAKKTVSVTAGPRTDSNILDPTQPKRTYPSDVRWYLTDAGAPTHVIGAAHLYDRNLLTHKDMQFPDDATLSAWILSAPKKLKIGAYSKIDQTWAETHVTNQATILRATKTLSDTEVDTQNTKVHATTSVTNTTVTGLQHTILHTGMTTTDTHVDGTQSSTLNAHVIESTTIAAATSALSATEGVAFSASAATLAIGLKATLADIQIVLAAHFGMNIGVALDIQIGPHQTVKVPEETNTGLTKTELNMLHTVLTGATTTKVNGGFQIHLASGYSLT